MSILLQVAELCALGGVPLNTATNRDLAASLTAAEKVAPDKAAVSLIKSLATRAMSEAQYFSTGTCLRPHCCHQFQLSFPHVGIAV
jgi:hypothetical protein